MKKVLTLLFLLFIVGCGKPLSYYKYRAAQYEANERLPQLVTSKNTNESISGGYYFDYMPIDFAETEDVRQSRHRYLETNFTYEFGRYGLYPAEYSEARYEIRYRYYTQPSFDGTFSHNFSLDISEREERRGTFKKKVWWGRVNIKKTTSDDISLYFSYFLSTILKGFPEPQNTIKDFIKSMEEKE